MLRTKKIFVTAEVAVESSLNSCSRTPGKKVHQAVAMDIFVERTGGSQHHVGEKLTEVEMSSEIVYIVTSLHFVNISG